MGMSILEPYRIGKMELKNRLMRSATWDGSADVNGAVTDGSVALYRGLGKGGIGLIVTGYAFIAAIGQANRGQYGIHTDDMIPGWRRLVKVGHDGGARIAMQIVHAGINSNYLYQKGITVLAVSNNPKVERPHREMTEEDIDTIISQFTAAAVRVREAGFDAVQLHGAHGYLMSQFLSPLQNHRTDHWGGSPQNRRRFHLEVIKAIRKAVGNDYPLFIKFGVQDDLEGGLLLSEGVETAREMTKAGLEAIEVSAGFGSPVQTTSESEPERAYFRERAAAVKHAVNVPVILVGGIRSPQLAQSIIDSGDADMISMSRPLIREPDLVNRWQKETKAAKCISCNQCRAGIGKGQPLECAQELRLREKA